MLMSLENFFPPFSPKMLLFLEKLLNKKIIKTSFPIKKGYIHFHRGRSLPFKRDLVPINCGFGVFSENTAFFEKTAK